MSLLLQAKAIRHNSLSSWSQVERCYAAPPGGDQLRCGPVVDAYVLPELHK